MNYYFFAFEVEMIFEIILLMASIFSINDSGGG